MTGYVMNRQLRGFEELMISEHWRLCDELTIKQATMLMIGFDPASKESECDGWYAHERPAGYEAVKQALSAALRKGAIAGTNFTLDEHDFNGNPVGEIPGTTNIDASIVERDSLVQWLRSREVNTGFFFPQADRASGEPDYLNPKHPRYSFRLAAAVRVWQAMEEENLRRGKGPIPAMEDWLSSRYKELGLVHRQSNQKSGYEKGDRNGGAISQVAKIANWNPDGGTPETPTAQNPPPPEA